MPIDQQTYDQLKGLWETVGGNPGAADVAAAVAFAESAGCQYALAGPVDIRPRKTCRWTKTNGENSAGYWQINLWAHPTYHAPLIFDEYANARAAKAISANGADWNAWSTYVNGAYLPFLRQYGGGKPKPPPPPPVEPKHDQIGMSWASGWHHFSRALGVGMPRNLAMSQHYRRATLRALTARRRIR